MTTPDTTEEITVGSEIQDPRILEPYKRWRSFAINYGLATIAIGITLAISILLMRNSISINLSLLVAIAILLPTWYGGIGPGLFVVATFQVITIISRPPTPEDSIVAYIFTHVSVFSVFVGLVFLVAWRRVAEQKLIELNATLEERVAERTAQLHASNQELESFSYSVSHDLRAPLRHINGFSLALLEDYNDKLDDVGKDYLRQVREASQEMAALIDDVLKLARLSRSEMVSESVDLTAMARSIIEDLKKDDAIRKVDIKVESGLSAQGDKSLLEIMLTNLICNAWKFTSKTEKAKITFGQDVFDDKTVYFVRDNGAGFDMDYADKLFGVFQRLHRTDEFEGTGVGLAIVQRIVSRHGGRVWGEGSVDKGATFYVSLPDPEEEKQ